MSLWILGGASFVAWFISMLAGGGSPLVLIPIVSVLLGAQAVAPVITLGMLIGNLQRTVVFRQAIDWQITRWQMPGALFGAILGSYLFTQIQAAWLQGLVAIALLLMAINTGLGRGKLAIPIKAWYFMPLAAFNAVLSGIVGSTGPVLNPIYLSYGLDKETLIATKSVNVAAMHVVKLLTYLSLGVMNPTYLVYGLVIGVAAIPANWLGQQFLERMSSAQFRQVVLGFVAVSGMWMLWQQRSLVVF
ncbi:MAG: sulfite exporter TauE/SafE family protein [Cyanobacteria bacterium P01_A01_bin.123]